MQRVRILGVPVDSVDMASVVEISRRWIAGGLRGRTIFAVNPEKIMHLDRSPELRQALEAATLLIPDGVGVVWAARFLHRVAIGRVPGADLFVELCQMAEREGYSVFLYGAREEVNAAAADELRRRFPRLTIAGRCNGYEQDEDELCAAIEAARPDLLFVALGSPRQELWVLAHVDRLPVGVYQGVGGSFDALTGNVKRAPHLWQRLNLEWAYRTLKQPRQRLGRIKVLPVFVLRVVAQRLRSVWSSDTSRSGVGAETSSSNRSR